MFGLFFSSFEDVEELLERWSAIDCSQGGHPGGVSDIHPAV